MSRWNGSPSKVWVVIALLFLPLLAVACGAAATATPAPTSVPQQPTVVQPTGAPATPTVVATATPAPSPAPAKPVVNPGKLTVMVGDLFNERFDNVFGTGSAGGLNYGRILHGLLISTNEKTAMVPGIASQWRLSPDGLTWTFAIRKGVKFHDGSEVTPQDVLWSLQHHVGPQAYEYALSTTTARVSRAMDRIELTGPDEVSLITKQPTTELAYLLSETSSYWWAIMPKRAKVHDTEDEAAYDNNPIGAGSMRLVKRVQASVMQFERFDDFYYQPKNGFPEDKRVKFQLLDMFLAPEEATRVAAIRAGDADLVPASLATKNQIEAGGGRIVFGQEGVTVEARQVGCWGPQKMPCQDKRVRQALDYAIDKEQIRRLYGGPEVFQVKGWVVVTPSTVGYTPELDPWPQDVAKARQLLADAGYPGGAGFGTLIVNTWPSTSMPFQVEAAQLAADFWRRELGLDVEVKVGDNVGVDKRLKAGELKGQFLWRENEARIDATSTLANRYGDPKHPDRAHEDPELFLMVQNALQTVDADKRAEASRRLMPRLREESYQLGIGYVNIPWGVGPRVLTWQPYPLAVYPTALHTITLK